MAKILKKEPTTANTISSVVLSSLKEGDSAVISKVKGHGSFRKRIIEMGFIKGQTIKVVKSAPMADPIEYEIMGYFVALRRSEASLIEVTENVGFPSNIESTLDASIPTDNQPSRNNEGSRHINVAIVGNPNSGKTSLFNVASGSNEHTGNYSGVTVDAKYAEIEYNNYHIKLCDLPGTYSITEYTPEELYVRKYLTEEAPDVVINVIDASNLERNLYLTTQLIDMNIKVVAALNMYDELKESGTEFDYHSFGTMTGIPFVPTIASTGGGVEALLDKVIDIFEDRDNIYRHIHINYGVDIENGILEIQHLIWKNVDIIARYSSRYLAIKLIDGDKTTARLLESCDNYWNIIEAATRHRTQLNKIYSEKPDVLIANAKYGFIRGALSETFTAGDNIKAQRDITIDKVFTHRYLGIPIFLLLMFGIFQATFTLGEYPANWIESFFSSLGGIIERLMNPGPLRDLIVNGIIEGIGGVAVFVPNILILFLFISIMEDTGYMARAAFIMDRLMHRIGLHGKSFIPLLMGFGCNVPAIMATRTLESRKDRLLTMLVIPFMSCSARLPIYLLLISTFFSSYQGVILMSIYTIGILAAIVTALILERTMFHSYEAPFVMELPPYRIPTLQSVIRHMWHRGVIYLKKIGTVILLASIIIWGLNRFPYDKQIEQQRSEISILLNDQSIDEQTRSDLQKQNLELLSQQQSNTYIGRMGHIIEPVFRPLGFDWKIGVSLITGLAAKETVVSTMAVLNTTDDEASLATSLKSQTHKHGKLAGQKVYTPIVAYTFMVFILLYFPCIAVIATIRKEAGNRWAVFTALYTTAIAWVVSWLVHTIGNLIV